MRGCARFHHADQFNMRDGILLSGLINLVQGLRITVGGDDLLLGQLCCDYRGIMRFSV
jgi:hypothetical protein